jgi:hypothetical protein
MASLLYLTMAAVFVFSNADGLPQAKRDVPGKIWQYPFY